VRPLRVLVFSTGLGTGGAERMLVKLAAELHGRGCEFAVVSLLDSGTQGEPLRRLGAPVEEMHMRQPTALARLPLRLRQAARRFAPDVIQGWMYHGNLAATIARRLAGSQARLFWGVRQSFYGMTQERPLTRLVIRANAALCATADAVIYNSALSMKQHAEAGFAAARGVVVPNGFDTARFRPDVAAREATRALLDLPRRAEVVGLVARDHPMKDHAGFFAAAAVVAKSRPDAVFVLAGTGIEAANGRIASLIREAGLGERVRLLGEVREVEHLLPAFDVAVLSSAWGEAFPNVLGEAMACGVPCVSTDVGDAAAIVGEAGQIVPREDSGRLAAAIVDVLGLGAQGRSALGEAGRRRVEAKFSLAAVAAQYLALYRAGGEGAIACAG
jgi:glycosyltransferase involved in cell wall biosynthesis